MLWILLGLLAGAGYALLARHSSVLAAPLDTFLTAVSDTGSRLVSATFRGFGLAADSHLAHIAAAIAGPLSVPLVCLALAEAAVIGKAARRATALVLSVCAFASFFFIPAPQAIMLSVAALVLNMLFALAHGAFVQAPLAAAVAALAVAVASDAWSMHGHLRRAASTVVQYSGGDVGIVRLALTVVCLMPVLAALTQLIRGK